jgi:hypothetical protein
MFEPLSNDILYKLEDLLSIPDQEQFEQEVYQRIIKKEYGLNIFKKRVPKGTPSAFRKKYSQELDMLFRMRDFFINGNQEV